MLAHRRVIAILALVTALTVIPLAQAGECVGASGNGVRTSSDCTGVSNQAQNAGGLGLEFEVSINLTRGEIVFTPARPVPAR